MTDKPRDHNALLFRYAVRSFGAIVLLAILMRTFVFSSLVMSGSAMLPSIWPGDFVIASKLRVMDLKRGSLVALRCPLVKDKLCLKRVIGLPGDRIEFKNSELILNGIRANYLPTGAFETEIVAGEQWAIWPSQPKGGNLPPVVVPPRSVFLLNDKRSDLDDSRQWGPVDFDLIDSRLVCVWMSLEWRDGDRVRRWPHVRWERLFHATD